MGNEACHAYLLRWVPDVLRDEARNVGLMVFPAGGGPGYAGRLRGDAPAAIRDFFASADKAECDWMAANAGECLRVRRMAVVGMTPREALEDMWRRLVAGSEESC